MDGWFRQSPSKECFYPGSVDWSVFSRSTKGKLICPVERAKDGKKERERDEFSGNQY
jgi:hypothetical protein